LVRSESTFVAQALEKPWPIVFVDRSRVVPRFSTHLGPPTLDRIDARRLEGSARSYAPAEGVAAVGLKGRTNKALAVAGFNDGSARTIAPQEAARIRWVAEPANHIDTDHEDDLYSSSPALCRIEGKRLLAAGFLLRRYRNTRSLQ
jgi:hypothetical protein